MHCIIFFYATITRWTRYTACLWLCSQL